MMLVFSRFSPKKIPFEDTTEAVVVLAIRGDGQRGGEVEWGVGGVVGGVWSTCTHPYFDLICSHSSLLRYIIFCNQNRVTIEEAFVTGQKVMGQASRKLGQLLSGSPEDLCFLAFFGVLA